MNDNLARKLEPTHVLPEDMQMANEYTYSRKHIDRYIQSAITGSAELSAKVTHGVQLLKEWFDQEHYASKAKRLQQLHSLDLRALVVSLFVGIAYTRRPELFVAVTSQLASRLNFDDKADSIRTVAEIVAVLCETDAFDIQKESDHASLMIVSRIQLPSKLLDAIDRSLYNPPMVCEPKPVRTNFESPYLTFNDSLILGSGNSHDGDLCLDVINIQNRVTLRLDLDFISTVEEVPNKPITNLDQEAQWQHFKLESYHLYELLAGQGNEFYLTNKVDKRGRLYAQGYHISSQGTSFKKAMIELADQEVVDGVPRL